MIDPFAPDALEDPYPLYDLLQREQPVTQPTRLRRRKKSLCLSTRSAPTRTWDCASWLMAGRRRKPRARFRGSPRTPSGSTAKTAWAITAIRLHRVPPSPPTPWMQSSQPSTPTPALFW